MAKNKRVLKYIRQVICGIMVMTSSGYLIVTSIIGNPKVAVPMLILGIAGFVIEFWNSTDDMEG